MLLWNMIRDFYVNYIFGGIDSNYNNNASNFMIGYGKYPDGTGALKSSGIFFDIGNGYSITIGDWLSTTATVITLVVLVLVLFLFLRWLFKVVSGLILLRN